MDNGSKNTYTKIFEFFDLDMIFADAIPLLLWKKIFSKANIRKKIVNKKKIAKFSDFFTN